MNKTQTKALKEEENLWSGTPYKYGGAFLPTKPKGFMKPQPKQPSDKPLRILIADDHEVTRDGAQKLIEREAGWEVCGTAATGREAIAQSIALQPDIVILDIGLPDMNGVEVAREMKRALPQTEILIFTGFDDSEEMIRKVFDLGVKSVILKGDGASQLVEAIRSLGEHRAFLTDKTSRALFARMMKGDRHGKGKVPGDELTLREKEVVQLLVDGKSNKQVANELGLGLRTVESHRATITRKLGLNSFAALVRYAIRNKIAKA